MIEMPHRLKPPRSATAGGRQPFGSSVEHLTWQRLLTLLANVRRQMLPTPRVGMGRIVRMRDIGLGKWTNTGGNA